MTDYCLPRATPESQGVSSRELLALIKKLDSIGNEVHGLMLERNGYLLAETYLAPYAAGIPHTCHSMGKSYTCTAVGIACREGLLDPEDLAVDLFAEEIALYGVEPSPLFRRLRLKDMMCMGDGMSAPSAAVEGWVEAYLRQEMKYEPGTRFMYNTMGSCMLALAVEKAVHRPLADYLREKLLEKIGIGEKDLIWLTFADGTCAEPGVVATTEANLRLAMFYLNDGCVGGERLLDSDWLQQAVSIQLTAPDGAGFDPHTAGYGWQLWIGNHPGQFRFDGGQGQLAVVDRDKNAAFSYHQGAWDPVAQGLSVSLVQDFLDHMGTEAMPEDPEGCALLQAYLDSRHLPAGEVRQVPQGKWSHEGTYYLTEGDVNFWIEVIPVEDEFFYLFYDHSVCWQAKTLDFRLLEDHVMMTVNGRSRYKLRLDGRQEVFLTEGGALPALRETCSTAYFEDEDTLVFTVRSLNSWVVAKARVHFSKADMEITVEKSMLHEGKPPFRRTGRGRRMR